MITTPLPWSAPVPRDSLYWAQGRITTEKKSASEHHARRAEGIEASSCREQFTFTIRTERVVGRGDVPKVPRGSLVGGSRVGTSSSSTTPPNRPPTQRLRTATDGRSHRRPPRRPHRPPRRLPPAAAPATRRNRQAQGRRTRAGQAGAGTREAEGRRRTRARRGRRVVRAARRRCRRRQEHERVAGRADGHQRAGHPGQADDRQPRRHQQPPQAHPRRQDLVHPPAGLRDRAGDQDVPQHEPALRRDRRQAERRHPRPHQPGPGDRPAGQGRQAATSSWRPSSVARQCVSASSSPPTRTSCGARATAS